MFRYPLRSGSQAANLLPRWSAGLVFFSDGLRKSRVIERVGRRTVDHHFSHPDQS